jgi:predicted nucleic acid-binding protein
VSEAWVVNASSVILVSRIGRLDLVERLAPRTLIPNAVIEEVRAGQHKDAPSAAALEWTARYRVEDLAVTASIERWDLGLGESQVIAHRLMTFRSLDRSASSCVRREMGTSIERVPWSVEPQQR